MNAKRDWLPPKALIGMVHVAALPGAPRHEIEVPVIAVHAAAVGRALADCGFDAVILENMHDRPYVHGRHGPEIIAAMTRIADEVAATVTIPFGIQILSGGEREALAVALASEAHFIRCENFVFSHVADEGLLTEAAAGPLLRYRKAIGADHVRVMCDVKKKHASHAITADLTIADCAAAAEFSGADGVIVTGGSTGRPTALADLRAARGATGLPVWVGSGADPSQLGDLYETADAVIVGSWIKKDGLWHNALDPRRCEAMVAEVRRVRG